MKKHTFSFAIALGLAALMIAISAAAQSIISTTVFTPPGVPDNVGFDFEVAVVESTGLVYVGSTGAYGNEVGVINPTTNAVEAVIPLTTVGALDFAIVNQTTRLIYMRQRSVGTIVVIDGNPSSATFNQALSPLILAGRQVRSFALDETRDLLYVTNNTIAPVPQSQVTIIDVNPSSATFHQVLNNVLLPPGAVAFGVAANTVTNRIYVGVTGGGLGGVYVLDGATLTLGLIAGSNGPTLGVVINENTNLIYATRSDNQLTFIDGSADAFVKFVSLPGTITAAGFDERLVINTVTGRVYILTPDVATSASLIVVDGNPSNPSPVLATIGAGRNNGNSLGFAVDEILNRVVVASLIDKTTSIIDGATNTLVASIPSTQIPSDVALDPNTHRVYVGNQQNFVQKINLATASVEATIVTAAENGLGVVNPNNNLLYIGRTVATTDVLFFNKDGASGTVSGLPHGSGRYVFLALNAATNRIYAVNSGSNIAGDSFLPGFISVIDGSSNGVIANVEMGNQPFGIGVNEATNKIYVVNAGFGIDFPSSITVIDGATHATTTADTSAFPPGAQFILNLVANETTNKIYFQFNTGGPLNIGVLDGATNVATPLPPSLGPVSAIAVNKTLNRVYVVSGSAGVLHVLDGATDAEIATLPIGSPSPGFDNIAVNETTGQVFVTNPTDDTLIAIDGASNTILATIPVGDNPRSVAVNALSNRIYVSNNSDKTISFIDGGSLTVKATLAVPLNPQDLAVDSGVSRVYALADNFSQSGVMVISDVDGTFDSLRQAITAATANDPPGIPNSLLTKVDNAQADFNRGDSKALLNKMKSLEQEVEAQRGKVLTDAEADHFIALIAALINSAS